MKAISPLRLRQLHKAMVPIMLVPLLVTLISGIGFQAAIVAGNGREFIWLMELHRGKFGRLNLEMIYPFLNGLGLLTLVITGGFMWWRSPSRPSKTH